MLVTIAPPIKQIKMTGKSYPKLKRYRIIFKKKYDGWLHLHFLILQANNGPGVHECGASALAVGGAAGTGATTLPACDAGQ